MLQRTVVFAIFSLTICRPGAAAGPAPEILGAEWASCAEEAKLAAEFLPSEASKTGLKTATTVFGAYAAAAIGEELAQRRREEVRAAFVLQMSGQKSKGEERRLLQSWTVDMERRSANCRQSFAENGPRFKSEVARMIAAGNRKEP